MTILWANVFPFPDPFTNFDKLCFLASLGAIICRVLPENLSFHLRRRLPIQQRPPSLSFTPSAQRMNCCGCLCRTCSHDTDSVLLLSQHRVISKQIKYLFIMMLCAVCFDSYRIFFTKRWGGSTLRQVTTIILFSAAITEIS